MMLNEYVLEGTKIKFFDDHIEKDVGFRKENIDKIIIKLLKKEYGSEEI